MKSTIKSISEDRLREIVAQSLSRSDVFRTLGMRISGSTFNTLDKRIEKFGISVTHFRRGCQTGNQKIPLDEIMVEGSHYNSNNLKKRLIAEGILNNKCSECGLGDTWNKKPLVLHLDHINGKRTDNRRKNLRLLCPNCHSQTPTFGFKKRITV